jgi:hypothetical protein
MEIKVIITAGEAIDSGIWGKLCNMRGINVYAVSEGLMNEDEKIVLTEKEAAQLGILNLPNNT